VRSFSNAEQVACFADLVSGKRSYAEVVTAGKAAAVVQTPKRATPTGSPATAKSAKPACGPEAQSSRVRCRARKVRFAVLPVFVEPWTEPPCLLQSKANVEFKEPLSKRDRRRVRPGVSVITNVTGWAACKLCMRPQRFNLSHVPKNAAASGRSRKQRRSQRQRRHKTLRNPRRRRRRTQPTRPSKTLPARFGLNGDHNWRAVSTARFKRRVCHKVWFVLF
jgi:hypothetical protein